MVRELEPPDRRALHECSDLHPTIVLPCCARSVVLEWDRRYLTVLGVAGKRLYELRLQVGRLWLLRSAA